MAVAAASATTTTTTGITHEPTANRFVRLGITIIMTLVFFAAMVQTRSSSGQQLLLGDNHGGMVVQAKEDLRLQDETLPPSTTTTTTTSRSGRNNPRRHHHQHFQRNSTRERLSRNRNQKRSNNTTHNDDDDLPFSFRGPFLRSTKDPFITAEPYNHSVLIPTTDNQSQLLKLKVPYPIFVLNLPKSGTTTIWQYFECGLGPNRAVHWWTTPESSPPSPPGSSKTRPRTSSSRTTRRAKSKQIGPCLDYNINVKHQDPLHRCGNFDVWIDCGYTAPPSRCFFPAIHGLEAFYDFHPRATLLLIPRDVDSWYASAAGWGRMLRKWSTVCRSSFFPTTIKRTMTRTTTATTTASIGEGEWKDFYQRTTERIRQFAKDHPSLTYLEPPNGMTLASPGVGSWLEESIGIEASCWGKCRPQGHQADCITRN